MNISDIAINYGGGVIALPARAAELDGAALRVLVRLACDEKLRLAYAETADAASAEMGFDRAALDRTVTELASKGLLSCSVKYGGDTNQNCDTQSPSDTAKAPLKPASSELPDYSGVELADLLDRDGRRFGQLIDECQRSLGRIFTNAETSKLVALCDYVGLEPEYVLMVCAYCARKNKNSVRYAERTAVSLYEEGVDSTAKLEEYIKQKEHYESLEYKIREMLGLGARALTKKEKEFLNRWIDEWRFGEDFIARAYEITVKYTDRAALPYLDKILAGWHERGYVTMEQLDAADAQRKTDKAESTGENASSFNTDEFFELALKRSYAKLGGETTTKSQTPEVNGNGL
jgi:DnaD and phage-associated domain